MILTIAGKELKSLFGSPLAWLVLAAVQLIAGYAYVRRLDEFLQLQSQLMRLASPPGATEVIAGPAFSTTAAVFLFAVPVLAMRLIAEERRNRTLALLFSAPVSMTEIVLGKFAGLFAFLLVIVALVALMPLTLASGTRVDFGLLAALTIGLALLAASFAAIGLYFSCLTVHPVVAALGSFALLLGMLLVGDVAADGLATRGWGFAAALAQVLSPIRNFEPFGRGLLDTHAIACAFLLTGAFLAAAIRQLDALRLRG